MNDKPRDLMAALQASIDAAIAARGEPATADNRETDDELRPVEKDLGVVDELAAMRAKLRALALTWENISPTIAFGIRAIYHDHAAALREVLGE